MKYRHVDRDSIVIREYSFEKINRMVLSSLGEFLVNLAKRVPNNPEKTRPNNSPSSK